MRKVIKIKPILVSSVAVLAFGATACSQAPTSNQTEIKQSSPMERLARAAVETEAKQQAEQTSETQGVESQPEQNAEEIEANKAQLAAMAALLSGATSIKEAAPDKAEAKTDVVPQPEAGPELSRVVKSPKIKRSKAPMMASPIDERASNGLMDTLSDASFSEVMSSWRGIKSCVKTITSRGLGGSGALKVKFKINAEGKVESTKVANASNLIAERVGDCVTRQARKIQFPAYAGTEIVSKEAKFVF